VLYREKKTNIQNVQQKMREMSQTYKNETEEYPNVCRKKVPNLARKEKNIWSVQPKTNQCPKCAPAIIGCKSLPEIDSVSLALCIIVCVSSRISSSSGGGGGGVYSTFKGINRRSLKDCVND
jgi:hypothetical protein